MQGVVFVQTMLLCYEGMDKSDTGAFKLCLQKFLWDIVVFRVNKKPDCLMISKALHDNQVTSSQQHSSKNEVIHQLDINPCIS